MLECVYVRTKWTRVNSVSAISVLPDTPEILRCRLDLFTSAALSNQGCLQTTWLLSDRRSKNPPVTTSVSLGVGPEQGLKLHSFKLLKKV